MRRARAPHACVTRTLTASEAERDVLPTPPLPPTCDGGVSAGAASQPEQLRAMKYFRSRLADISSKPEEAQVSVCAAA